MPSALIYVHGFQGSPQSAKARQLGQALVRDYPSLRYRVPELGFAPRAAMQTLEQTIDALAGEGFSRLALVGSSMGGYYAGRVAGRRKLRAVLINPVVDPRCLFESRLGPVENPWTGERHVLSESDLADWQGLDEGPEPDPDNLLVLLQTGDETLDWCRAWQRYADCQILKLHGGDHSFVNFEDCFPLIYRFAGLASS